MLEKPPLQDQHILKCLRLNYGLTLDGLEFLPIGNDSSAWVYKVDDDGLYYFLKVKRGDIPIASLDVPRFLHETGIEPVVAPIANNRGEYWTALDDFVLILYPYIVGQTGMDSGLTPFQWHELGTTLKRIHTIGFPAKFISEVPRESFIPNRKWTKAIRSFKQMLAEAPFTDDLEREFAVFWQQHSAEIDHIVHRTETLGQLLRNQTLPFVLCHADFHTANVLIDDQMQIYIVDWDQPIFAPKERDLMFVVGGRIAGSGQNELEQAFLNGYGQPDVDWLAVAYYRYEWVVQEIGDYVDRMFFAEDAGTITKKDSLKGFMQLFQPGDVIEAAYDSEAYLTR